MKEERFSIEESLRFGWYTMKNNLIFFIAVLLIFFAVGLIPSIFNWTGVYMSVGGAIAFYSIGGLLSIAIGTFVDIAQVKITLRFCDGGEAEYEDLYSGYRNFWNMLAGSILYALIVIGGLILFIVPGIYWAVKYWFYRYFIVDKGMGPIDALKRSGQVTYGAKWWVLLFALVVIGINILGALACGIGLFVTVPITMVATAYVYRQMLSTERRTETAQEQAPA